MACVKGSCPQDPRRDGKSHFSEIEGHNIKGLTHERKDVSVRAWRQPAPYQSCLKGRGDISLNPAVWTLIHPKDAVGAAGHCSLMPSVRPLSSVSTLSPQVAFDISQLQGKRVFKSWAGMTRASPCLIDVPLSQRSRDRFQES